VECYLPRQGVPLFPRLFERSNIQLRRRGQLSAHCFTHPMRLLYAAFLLMVSSFIHAQSASPNPSKLYAVIFDVTVNSAGKVQTLEVAKVIDPSTHSTDAANVAVPDSYLTAAKALLIKTNYGTNPTHFNTWLFYDPARPNRADIDPESGRP
jgi:hypothetical protein